MRQCTKCLTGRPKEDFYAGTHSWCRPCRQTDSRERSRKIYAAANAVAQTQARKRKRIKEEFRAILKTLERHCTRCDRILPTEAFATPRSNFCVECNTAWAICSKASEAVKARTKREKRRAERPPAPPKVPFVPCWIKRCSKCGGNKPLLDFHRHSQTRDGRSSWCQRCSRGSNAQYVAANGEAVRAKKKEYKRLARRKAGVPEQKVGYRPCCVAHVVAYRDEQRRLAREAKEDTKEAVRLAALLRAGTGNDATRRKKAYYEQNPHVLRAKKARRRAAALQAAPPWADAAKIRAIYAEAKRLTALTGILWHVDHIVPLNSPLVCGLHCEANLEPLPDVINLAKRNSFWPDMP